MEKTHPYSLFTENEAPESDSLTNFQLDIKSSFKGREEETSAALWMFDSKDTGCLGEVSSYACIGKSQIEWYKRKSDKIN